MKDIGAIVMAAGLGKRMRSKLAKVLHPVAGRPMVLYAVELAERVATEGVAVVVGHQADKVKAVLDAHHAAKSMTPAGGGVPQRAKGVTARVSLEPGNMPLLTAEQAQQLGTGHAVMQARAAFLRARRSVASAYAILNGDTPLLTEITVQELLRVHEEEKATITILTAVLDDPSGYGRVVRHPNANIDRPVLKIVEDRDATPEEAEIREVNVGTYVVDGPFLFEALDALQPQNAQQEYYLTDIVKLAVERGLRVSALIAKHADEGMGINSRQQLAAAERVLRSRICERWMQEGVTLRDPATISIDADVRIGQDSVVYPYVTLEGRTTIGPDCEIRSHSRITDSVLGKHVVVQDCCVIREAHLEDDTTVGPFAHLRPGAVLRRSAKVGNFVEMKKTDLGEGSKANHLTYLGDAKIGKGVNIGAGTITCNYDGFHKFETVIEDEVFIGSDTQLIAPVRVGRGAVVAAGSSVTEEVPADALAISRSMQVNRPGWAARRRALPATDGRRGAQSTGKAEPTAQSPTPRPDENGARDAKPLASRSTPRSSENTRTRKGKR
ncbi:MAG TPA: bifunctional UDP-N-acetylglucosamine diphosphorylase/glucosamine-1-phosphate N-acetyltransferase GlmU, partial [Nitrospiraceae bacterium]|nr:bifunctional UDP-N-acetylglucosamine diphosphorylase/glucosamine-1-phosphate N-acetyltransferase GlmU [Nitrospiraceae bacterium]